MQYTESSPEPLFFAAMILAIVASLSLAVAGALRARKQNNKKIDGLLLSAFALVMLAMAFGALHTHSGIVNARALGVDTLKAEYGLQLGTKSMSYPTKPKHGERADGPELRGSLYMYAAPQHLKSPIDASKLSPTPNVGLVEVQLSYLTFSDHWTLVAVADGGSILEVEPQNKRNEK